MTPSWQGDAEQSFSENKKKKAFNFRKSFRGVASIQQSSCIKKLQLVVNLPASTSIPVPGDVQVDPCFRVRRKHTIPSLTTQAVQDAKQTEQLNCRQEQLYGLRTGNKYPTNTAQHMTKVSTSLSKQDKDKKPNSTQEKEPEHFTGK